MNDATSPPETGARNSSAIAAEPTNARPAEVHRAGWHPRRYALVGVGLFLFSWLLGAVGAAQGLPMVVPFAEMSLGLALVLALFGAVLAGAAWREIVPIGILSGVGHFYKGQDHTTHVLSGWGLGLEHLPHIILGLVLIGAATAWAAAMAFHHTKGKVRGQGA